MTNAEARFNKIHIRKVYACLAVTCHLHFWQNDRDFLRATVVTRGWNGYRNKSQHRKSTLEKKILPPFQQGFEPATFQSRVRCSNHWAIPAPQVSAAGSPQLLKVIILLAWNRSVCGRLRILWLLSSRFIQLYFPSVFFGHGLVFSVGGEPDLCAVIWLFSLGELV